LEAEPAVFKERAVRLESAQALEHGISEPLPRSLYETEPNHSTLRERGVPS
jgi:hypothetical protein